MPNSDKKKYFFPIHLKLVLITFASLLFLATLFFVSVYINEKKSVEEELVHRNKFLEALIAIPYKKMTREKFLDYAKSEQLVSVLSSLDVSHFLIMDENNRLVYSNYPSGVESRIMPKISETNSKISLELKKGENNFLTILSKETQTYDFQILLSKNDSTHAGILYISSSLKHLHSKTVRMFIVMLFIVLLISIILIFVFSYTTKTITNPVRTLKNAAEKVASGDFNNIVTFKSDDDIGLLAKAFNEMTSKLKTYNNLQIDQIKALNEELIQKNFELESSYEEVESTNEELETTNEELLATNEELEIANRDLFAMAQDIKKSKEELEKNIIVVNSANEELKLLNKMKTSFLGMASHELKTPLVMIKGYAELILDTKASNLNESTLEMVTHILKGADTLNSIIRDMLDITKIDAKELKLHIIPVELKLVIDTAVLEMREVASKRSQILNVGDFPKINILVDAPQIHRVLVHLISNAIKFTPDNGKISIYANIVRDEVLSLIYKEEERIDFIDIVVEDTGIGIDKSEQDRIFEAFYEVGDIDHHRTSKTAYLGKGSGLGLTICKGIIEAHRGRIWVESDEVNLKTFPGSKFHIILPLKHKKEIFEKAPLLEEIIKQEKEEAGIPALPYKPKILLIEDEKDIIDLTILILQEKFNVEVANNGADGIKKVFEIRPNLILLDIYMKGLNGFEVCSILKSNERTKNIPIAMFTAGTQKYEIEKGYKVGVNDYITKPFNPSELIERVEKLIYEHDDTKPA